MKSSMDFPSIKLRNLMGSDQEMAHSVTPAQGEFSADSPFIPGHSSIAATYPADLAVVYVSD